MEPRTKTLILCTLALCVSSLNASAETITKVTVEQNSATESFYVKESGKLYFSGSALIIDEDGDSETISRNLSTITRLQFSQSDNSELSATMVENSANLCVYPNPASDFLVISSDKQESLHYDIYDAQGNLVQSGTANSGEEIRISHLPNGLYIIKTDFNLFKFSKI